MNEGMGYEKGGMTSDEVSQIENKIAVIKKAENNKYIVPEHKAIMHKQVIKLQKDLKVAQDSHKEQMRKQLLAEKNAKIEEANKPKRVKKTIKVKPVKKSRPTFKKVPIKKSKRISKKFCSSAGKRLVIKNSSRAGRYLQSCDK